MSKVNHDHDHDRDVDTDRDNPANDNAAQKAPVVVVPAGGALVSLAALGAALNSVDTTSVAGRSGHPMLSFKREGDGSWMFGQKRTKPESNSRWAVNPTTFQRGYVCFGASNNFLGEKLLPVSQPMLDPAVLPDKGFEWTEQWAVNLKCVSGTDAGAEVIYKPTTTGGIQAITGLIDEVRDRLNGGQHDGKVSPIVLLEKISYPHVQYGKVWTPLLNIVDWMSLQGPAPAPVAPPPAASPSPTAQPRRRRVG